MTNEMKRELNWLKYCAENCDETRFNGFGFWDKISAMSDAQRALYEAAKSFTTAWEADPDLMSTYEKIKECEEFARR